MFNRGGFPGQRPMMNQPGTNLGKNMSGMNMPGMNMGGMNMPAMNQPNMNLSGMNPSGMNTGMSLSQMGQTGMNRPNMGFSGMNQTGLTQPGMNQPRMNQPGMNQPRMNQPGMNQPRMNQPGMNQPRMNQPGMNQPRMNQPGMNQPRMNQPGMNQPRMNQPGMNQPRMNQPGMNQPGMNQPGMNQPGMKQTGMNQPGMKQTGMNQPGMNLAGMNQPGMNLAGMNQPGMNLAGMNQTGMSQFGMNQPAMGLNRMNDPSMNQGGMNQGGMGFPNEMKSQGFGMRPMDSPGSFGGGNLDPMGMKGMPVRLPMQHPPYRQMGPQAMPQQFPGPNVPSQQGQPIMESQRQELLSIVNMLLNQTSDNSISKPNNPIQEPSWSMKDTLGLFGNLGQEMGMKSSPISTMEQTSNAPNRYTNESASSILESFGLSNEDLEELSRYPDDQLTPGNMSIILRDIRLRKMSRPGSTPDQGGRRPGSEMAASQVIDYGHSSKFPFTDHRVSERSYDSAKSKQASKEHAASSNKPERTPDKSMDNKIPAISGSRKPTWQSSKPDRSNNKTLVNEQNIVTSNVNVSQVESPVVGIQTDNTVLSEVTTPAHTDVNPEVPVATKVGNVKYQLSTETALAGKGSRLPGQSREETQKLKKLPTPSMMNDYFAASPRIFPHICSLCKVECRHLKDWIKHQNDASHIENCRKLRQQYPDWNPQGHSSQRNEGNDENKSKRSKSRSRSPRRSRSPIRGKGSPRPSHSPRRPNQGPSTTSSASPGKRAVDPAVESFIAAGKTKSGENAKASNNANNIHPKPSSTNVKPNTSTTSAAPANKSGSSTSDVSSPFKKPSSGGSNVAAQRPSSGSTITKQFSSSTVKKPIVSSAAKKTTPISASSRKMTPSKPSASAQKAPAKSSVAAASYPLTKATSKNNTGNIVHITNLPDDGYTDQDILKIFQPFGKVCNVLTVRSKNEAFVETNFDEAATAAVSFSETTPVMINKRRVTLSLVGNEKPEKDARSGRAPVTPSKQSSHTAAKDKNKPLKEASKEKEATKDKDKPLKEASKEKEEIPPGFVKRYKLADPPLTDSEKCVVLVSNLPETKFTVEDISKLAKPFGGVTDILVISTHRKAYLELGSKTSVDNMIKFYNVFPTYLGGNLLKITSVPRYKDLKDEDRIFVDLIEQAPYKITPTIYERFVYLLDLPETDVPEYDVFCVGLRFGKVEHYAIFSNKRKAIVHMQTANAAKAMRKFLAAYPCSIGGNVVKVSSPAKTKLDEDQYVTFLEEEEKESPEPKVADETEVATTPEDGKPKEIANKRTAASKEKEDTATSLPTSPVSQTEMEIDMPPNKKAKAPEIKKAKAPEIKKAKAPEIKKAKAPEIKKAKAPEIKKAKAPEIKMAKAPQTAPVPSDVKSLSKGSVQKSLPSVPARSAPDVSVQKKSEAPQTAPVPSDVKSLAKAVPETVKESPPLPTAPNHTAPDLAVQATAADDDDEEEAAQAPEAPDVSPIYIQPEPVLEHKKPSPVSQSLLPEELEVLVTVESDGEDSEDQSPSVQNANPVTPSVSTHQSCTSGTSVTSTTKYNPQKGGLSVTHSTESQKPGVKTGDSRKRSSGEKGYSGHDSCKSNSNRSSPTGSSSSNPRSRTVSSLKKTPHQARDLKSNSRSQERNSRTNTRKDDRSKGNSSSSRYSRDYKTSARGPRSKEDDDEAFPFNMDDFITVDEIVEEHGDSKSRVEEEAKPPQVAGTPRKRSRKENDPVSSDTKKSRVMSADPQELSFVTLDEVGDEEENMVSEHSAPRSGKGAQMLMTLDEISDDEETQESTTGLPSAQRQILAKDEASSEDPIEGVPVDIDFPHTDSSQDNHTKQQLLTLDEEQDEEFLADIENRFFTVDEVGDEEEESKEEMKVEEADKSKTSTTNKSVQSGNKTSS